jgi:hypothetical protein
MRASQAVLALLCALLSLPLAAPARAADVYLTSASEDIGHGWLFGSRTPSSQACWIAVPRHVAEASPGGPLLPLRFRARIGNWGETGQPVAVDDVPGAAQAAGTQDLAFAEVLSGPRPGECLDRLGLQPLLYEAALERRDPLFIRSMLPESFGDFQVALDGGASGDRNGLLRLAAADPADAPIYFKRGLSGAIATLTRPTGAEPMAMILEVEPDQKTALALGFDRIRAAFDLVEAAVLASRREAQTARSGLPYAILGFSGISVGDGPAATLNATEGCWRVVPEGGQRQVQLLIDIDAPGAVIGGLTLLQAPDCGAAPLDVTIDQRASDRSGWSRTRTCTTLATDTGQPACHLDLRAPRQLRIGITARGQIGLSGLRLY